MSSESFAGLVGALARQGYDGVTLSQLLGLNAQQSSARSVAITFDDGYVSALDGAFPILEQVGWKATVFLVTDYCGGTNQWPSQPRGYPAAPLLDWNAVETLASAGWEIASHTRSHPPLTQLPIEAAEEEIVSSLRRVEERTGQSCEVFSYPYGEVNQSLRQVVAQHFEAAVGTRLGLADDQSDIYNLERVDSYYLSEKLSVLESRGFRTYLSTRRFLRRLSRIVRKDWGRMGI